MYKLLTTAAVIMAVATPSIANQWTGGQKLTKDLNDIYTGLDGVGGNGASAGTDAFGGLVNTDGSGSLHNFLTAASAGVTYITISSDATSGMLSLGVNEGTTLEDIQNKQKALVTDIQTDLFGADEAGTVYDPANPDVTDGEVYQPHTQGGLVGTAINGLVTDVNALNTGLIDGSTTHSDIIDESGGAGNWTLKTGNATVDSIQGTLTGINGVTTIANGSGGYFDNLNDFTVDGSTSSNFRIGPVPIGTVAPDGIGFTDYTAWANNVVTINGVVYTFDGSGSLGLNGGSTAVTVDGTEVTDPGADGRFTVVP